MIATGSQQREHGWIDGLKAGDESAFSQIYRQYWSALYAVAYNHVRARDVAEELVQDLFATLWLKREQLTIHTSLSGYLHTAIRHQIYDYIDKQAVRQRVHEQLAYEGVEAGHTTEQTVDYDELQMQLVDAVEHLPQPAQTIFRLSRYEYLSTQAIAVQLNLSPKMVEYHLTRALRQLRSQLKEFFALLLVFFLPFP